MKLIAQAAFCFIATIAAGSAFAVTADELIAKNIEARGGLKALESIESLTATGIGTFGGGDFSVEFGLKNIMARPAMMRSEGTFQGMTQVNAFDGKDAWAISPFQGRVDPERKSDDEARISKIQADLEGVLINAEKKGYAIDYMGLEDVDGTMAHKVRVKLNATDTRFVFLDPDHFLEIRYEDRFKIRGAEITSVTDIGDYEKVNGWFVPFYVESNGQKISYDKIEANAKLDPAQFAFPVKK